MPLALPSLGNAVAVAWQTLRRFPLAILAGALAATAAILGVEDVGAPWLHERLVTTATLGIALCAAAELLAERQGRTGRSFPIPHRKPDSPSASAVSALHSTRGTGTRTRPLK